MPTRRKTAHTDTPSGLCFEDAMEELEAIVEAMESEELPLGELVTQYESGTALLKHCTSALSAAKKRIELITLADGGETGGTPENGSADSDETNDISLF